MASVVQETKKRKYGRQSEKGQIALEYVLIMLAGVGIAFVINQGFASRSADSPGKLVKRWHDLTVAIGADLAD